MHNPFKSLFFLVNFLVSTAAIAQTLTPEQVLKLAKGSSETYRAIESYEGSVEAVGLRADAPFDSRFTAATGISRDRREPESPFSPNRIDGTFASLGVSKAFSSGTAAEFQFRQGWNQLGFGGTTVPPLDYADSRFSLGISQSLLRDGFGSASRRGLRAAELSQSSASLRVREQREEWALEILTLYYSAWLSQQELKASRQTIERRQRLLSIAEIRSRRGTTEEPDLLQIQASVLSSKNDEARADQALRDQWTALVDTLKLGPELASLDPVAVPLDLDAPIERAKQACTQNQKTALTSAKLERLTADRGAAELLEERARINSRADLKLIGGVATNGIDGRTGAALSEGARGVHPAWNVGLQLTVPLENSAEKAERLEAIALATRSDAEYLATAESERNQWRSSCASLARLEQNHQHLARALELQKKRSKGQAGRFDVGRVAMFDVIAAEDDANRAELLLHASEVERRRNAWQILRLSGQLHETLGAL